MKITNDHVPSCSDYSDAASQPYDPQTILIALDRAYEEALLRELETEAE